MTEQTAEQYDPSAHTVEEVQAYLATASPDEVDRVLDAEEDGKARVGVLSFDAEEARTEAYQEYLVEVGVLPPPPGTRLSDTEDGYGRVVVDAYPAPADA